MISANSWITRLLSFAAAVSMMGCAHQYAAEPLFGQSVRGSVVQQSIRVAGVGHDRIEPGLDGQAAKAVMDRYIRSYEQPQPLGNVFRLGVGTPVTSGFSAGGGVPAVPR